MSKIKEQLVSLTVELEEKTKVEKLLSKRVEVERKDLEELEDEMNKSFTVKMNKEASNQKELVDELTARTHELIEKKSGLLKQCKDLADRIKEVDLDQQAELRGVYREIDEHIEKERKKFKLTSDERFQKYLAQKSEECKISTEKALQPELSRIENEHEQEIHELKMKHEANLKRMKEEYEIELKLMSELESDRMKSELKQAIKNKQEKASKEIEYSYKDQNLKLNFTKEKYDRELEKYQSAMQEKTTKLRKTLQEEIQSLQTLSQEKIIELKRTHAMTLDKLKKDHQSMIQELTYEHCRLKKEIEDDGRSLFTDTDDEDEESNKRGENKSQKQYSINSSESISTPKKSRVQSMNIQSSFDFDSDKEEDKNKKNNRKEETKEKSPKRSPYRSPTKATNKPPASSPSRHNNQNKNKTNDQFKDISKQMSTLSIVFQQQMNDYQDNETTKRNKILQKRIHNLEKQRLLYEKSFEEKYDSKKQSLVQLFQQEEDQIISHQHTYNNALIELINTREEKLRMKQQLIDKEKYYQQEIEQFQKEISMYQSGINSYKSRVEDKTQQYKFQYRELQLEYSHKNYEIQEMIAQLTQEYESIIKDIDHEKHLLEKQHFDELNKLDLMVKQQVQEQDMITLQLKEDIEMETTRFLKLKDMIQQYDQLQIDDQELNVISTGNQSVGTKSRLSYGRVSSAPMTSKRSTNDKPSDNKPSDNKQTYLSSQEYLDDHQTLASKRSHGTATTSSGLSNAYSRVSRLNRTSHK